MVRFRRGVGGRRGGRPRVSAAPAAQETPKDLRVAVGRWPVSRVAPGVTIVWKFETTMPIRE